MSDGGSCHYCGRTQSLCICPDPTEVPMTPKDTIPTPQEMRKEAEARDASCTRCRGTLADDYPEGSLSAAAKKACANDVAHRQAAMLRAGAAAIEERDRLKARWEALKPMSGDAMRAYVDDQMRKDPA